MTTLVGVGGPALLIVLLARPMLQTPKFIGFDWYAHLWYIWHQAGSLRANGVPSLFAHNGVGMFDPHYAFYGGTLYVLAGALTLVVGSAPVAYVMTYLVGFASAYGGCYWLARVAGVGRWAAHAPGILFITAPYYLATIYGGGGWAEFTAVSTIPLLLASTWSVMRARRLRAGPTAALAWSTLLFTGSHNLTLVWGTTVLLIVGSTILVLIPSARRSVTRAGLRRVALVAGPAALVNAWFLLPDLVYQSHTVIAHNSLLATVYLKTSMYLIKPSRVFSLGRATSDPTVPHFAFQLPVLAAAWLLIGLVVLWTGRRTGWFHAVLILLTAMVALTVLMLRLPFLLALPSPWGLLQLGYRLEAYIQLGLAAAVIALLALAARSSSRRRLWAWAIVPVLMVSIVEARSQVNEPAPAVVRLPPWSAAQPYRAPIPVPGSEDYADYGLPRVDVDPSMPSITIPPAAEHGNRAVFTMDAQPGQIVRTNIIAAPRLIKLTGARFFGRDRSGVAVMEISDDATPGAARVSVQAARPWPIVAGWVLSLLGLAGLTANALAIALSRRRVRRGDASPESQLVPKGLIHEHDPGATLARCAPQPDCVVGEQPGRSGSDAAGSRL